LARPPLIRLVVALALGAVGGLMFELVGFPAAWLAGSMTFVSVAVILGLRSPFPSPFRFTLFGVLGLTMGSGVTPEVVARLGSWPVSMMLLAVTMLGVGAGVYLFLVRVYRWDSHSAFFASIPGALSYVLAIAQVSRADLPRVALSQSLRVFLLVAMLPAIIVYVGGAPFQAPQSVSPDIWHLAILIVAGTLGGALAEWLRIPAGTLIGALVVSAALYATGIVEGTLPQPIQIAGFVGLGCMIGLRFTGVTFAELKQTSMAGLGAFLVSTVIAAAGALAASLTLGFPIGETFIAFAPGGLEAMVILAFALGLDPAYVAAHHLARFLAMVFLVPFFARRVLGKGWSTPPADT
jgi:membrane AbrB-like protein